MNIYNDDVLTLLLFAFLFGGIFGVVYDVLHSFAFVAGNRQPARAKKLFCALEYISLFFADLTFCLLFGAGALILMYNMNKGVFRFTVYIMMGLGFAVYRVTASGIIRKLLFWILLVLRKISGIIYRIISVPIRLIFKIYHLTIGKIICIIIYGIKNKREANRQKKRERALVASADSGKEAHVTSTDNSENNRKERIFIGRKNAGA